MSPISNDSFSLNPFLFVMTSFGLNKESLENPETRKTAVENLLEGLQIR